MPRNLSNLGMVTITAAMNGGAIGTGLVGVFTQVGVSRQTVMTVFVLATLGALFGSVPGAFLLIREVNNPTPKDPDGRARRFGRDDYFWMAGAFLSGALFAPLGLLCLIPLTLAVTVIQGP